MESLLLVKLYGQVEDYTVIIDGAAFNAVNSTSANDNSGFDFIYIRTRHLTLLIFLQTLKKVLIKFIIPKDLKFKGNTSGDAVNVSSLSKGIYFFEFNNGENYC
jgi:hypothetical protein